METILTWNFDILQIVLIVFLFIFSIIVSLFLGLWMDIRRQRQIKQMLNPNLEIYTVNILSADKRRFKPFLITLPNGVIKYHGKKWIVSGSRIYREDKTEQGIDLKSDDTKKRIAYDGLGSPQIFVSEDDFKVLGLEHSEDLRPDEIDAIMNADLQNELARRGSSQGTWSMTNMLLITIIFMAGITLFVTILTKLDVGNILTSLGDLSKVVTGGGVKSG